MSITAYLDTDDATKNLLPITTKLILLAIITEIMKDKVIEISRT